MMNQEEEYYYNIWREKIKQKEYLSKSPSSVKYYTYEKYEFIYTYAFSREGIELNDVIQKLSDIKKQLYLKTLTLGERSYYLQEQRVTHQLFNVLMKRYSDEFDKCP